jgi:hypothetical protein
VVLYTTLDMRGLLLYDRALRSRAAKPTRLGVCRNVRLKDEQALGCRRAIYRQ